MNENNDQGNEHLFSIKCQNNKNSIEKVIIQIDNIELSHQVTEVLHKKSRLSSTEFENHLRNFETASLEIKYPSSLFDSIYKQLCNLKKKISHRQESSFRFLSVKSSKQI